MLQRLQRPPFTNQLNHSEQQLRLACTPKHPVKPLTTPQTNTVPRWRKGQTIVFCITISGCFCSTLIAMRGEQLKLSQPWDGFPVFGPDGTRLQ